MKFQRSLLLLCAAALTAGTCAANPTIFQLYLGTGSQAVSLAIDDTAINSIYGAGSTFYASTDLSDGWHKIELDYTYITGTSHLGLDVNNSGSPLLDHFGSYDALGLTINGLTGVFYALDGTTHQPTTTKLATDYGEGPIYFTPTNAPWNTLAFTTSAFQEQLTGYVYIGTGTPSLADVPAGTITTPPTDPPPTDPPPTDGGDAAPEPGSWCLVAAALPLILFSKLRLKHARQ